MPTYDLPYAKEHLDELFEEAHAGEEVIIVRSDGCSCRLLPLVDVMDEAPAAEEANIPDWIPGSLVPA
jgi:antitoxin (DNA-binding transcriptional repressor) of toxin-antitoxin stability system